MSVSIRHPTSNQVVGGDPRVEIAAEYLVCMRLEAMRSTHNAATLFLTLLAKTIYRLIETRRCRMEKRWCFACGMVFEPRAQCPRQAYCTSEDCQRARKRLWQQAKRKTDDDYHQNQLEAQKAWQRAHPAYWRDYRDAHPEYTAGNRNLQRARNKRRTPGGQVIAKADASSRWPPPAGLFKLVELRGALLEQGRAWTVRLVPLASEAQP
jgi:hypothetical protein